MRHQLVANYRKYVQGYGFFSFARKFGDKYGKKLMDTATKTGIDAAKTASKRIVQKTAEATGDLIGNKIADKITSVGKSKSKEKKIKDKRFIFHQKRGNKSLMISDCFRHHTKMEYQKIVSLLDLTSDSVPRFVTKKWI